MNNQFSSKTFSEKVQPDAYKEYGERRDELVLSSLGKLESARLRHEQTVKDMLPCLAALQVQALEAFTCLNAFGVGLNNFRDFTFEHAISYQPPERVDVTEASTVQIQSRASLWVQHNLGLFSRAGLNLPERFQRTAELQIQFQKSKENISAELFKTSRERGTELASAIEVACAQVQGIPHGRPDDIRVLHAIARALRTFSQEDMIACEMPLKDVRGDGSLSKATHVQLIKMIERSIAHIAEGVIEATKARPLEVAEIVKQHGRSASELKMPARVSLDRYETLILKYFSLTESLANPGLEEGARWRYTEMRDEIIPDLQSMNRKDRAHSVKSLQRLGKMAGWDIVPSGIDDSFWATIGHSSQPSIVASEPVGAPVHVALKPFLQDAGRKVAGINVKQLERDIKVGTVEGVVRALEEVLPNPGDVTAILSANPKVFLEFQKPENGNFARFVQVLRDARATIEAIRARGGDVLASQLTSVESVRVLVDGEARRSAFVKAKGEVLATLNKLGFEEPELALVVLRRGTLVKGSYQTVSERTFDDFAKKGVEASQEIKVPAIRDQLLRRGLLTKRGDGALSLPVRLDGKRGSLVAWVRANHPGTDIA